MPHCAEDHRLVTLYELADALELPAKWLAAEAKAGRVPHLEIGRKLMFSAEAVRLALFERAQRSVNQNEKCPETPETTRGENNEVRNDSNIAPGIAT